MANVKSDSYSRAMCHLGLPTYFLIAQLAISHRHGLRIWGERRFLIPWRRPHLSTSGSIQSNLAKDPSALSPCLSPTSLCRHSVSQIVFTQVHEQN